MVLISLWHENGLSSNSLHKLFYPFMDEETVNTTFYDSTDKPLFVVA